MTYLEFHLFFNFPLLAALVWLVRKRLTIAHARWLGVVCIIVLAFTFPWDSYAVGKGIWEFDNSRVAFRIGNLPVEEILFFILETVAVCLLVLFFLPRHAQGEQ